MKNSAIEWTHHTFNPWIGCTQVSPACDHCYAMVMMDHRYHRVEWGAGKPRIRTSAEYWRQPLRWNRAALRTGIRERVFCASLADVFDGEMSAALDFWREDLWRLINDTPHLDWLLLTKRPGNIRRLAPWGSRWPHNVWVGTSVENEEWARRRLPVLSEVPAVVRFVSAEPLLSDFSIAGYDIDWLIAGGESGRNFRPLSPEHVRSIRDRCIERRIAFFFKQWGGQSPKANGRELDGKEWSEIPIPKHDRGVLSNRDKVHAHANQPVSQLEV
jgi:protein gp37